jgi:peptidoglycan/xylan/chitin deacetylase (PgdA/CDA1 family)
MHQRPLFKRIVVRLLTADPVVALTSRSSGWAAVFMLHRFRSEAERNPGHDPQALRATLAWLRAHRYDILDLESLFRRLAGEGPPLRTAVAFTLDDGYAEQAEVAAPLFAEFDAPSTTFVATGFLDGMLWFWWDQLEYVLSQTQSRSLTAVVGVQALQLDLSSDLGRRRALADLTERCKAVPEAEKHDAILRLAAEAGVELPKAAPCGYRPMTWDQARRAERQGMRFGPQTVSHPILSRTDAAQSRQELQCSWQRVMEELEQPVPIFCYPNGQPDDFGAREIETLKRLGFAGAVTGSAGYGEQARAQADSDARFRLPRFPYSDLPRINIQFASGVERIKSRIRHLVGPTT